LTTPSPRQRGAAAFALLSAAYRGPVDLPAVSRALAGRVGRLVAVRFPLNAGLDILKGTNQTTLATRLQAVMVVIALLPIHFYHSSIYRLDPTAIFDHVAATAPPAHPMYLAALVDYAVVLQVSLAMSCLFRRPLFSYIIFLLCLLYQRAGATNVRARAALTQALSTASKDSVDGPSSARASASANSSKRARNAFGFAAARAKDLATRLEALNATVAAAHAAALACIDLLRAAVAASATAAADGPWPAAVDLLGQSMDVADAPPVALPPLPTSGTQASTMQSAGDDTFSFLAMSSLFASPPTTTTGSSSSSMGSGVNPNQPPPLSPWLPPVLGFSPPPLSLPGPPPPVPTGALLRATAAAVLGCLLEDAATSGTTGRVQVSTLCIYDG